MRTLRAFSVVFFMGLFFLLNSHFIVAKTDDLIKSAEEIASHVGMSRQLIQTRIFSLIAFVRFDSPGGPLRIYIEGDGRAWISKHRLSNDPTPLQPLALELSATDRSSNVAYLARPCQYGGDHKRSSCDPVYWSDKRFSEEVISSMNEAVDQLKRSCGTNEIHLIGYSGGAAVAVLLAARRNDIVSLRTVAGNLDPEAVNRYHKVDSLTGSLDPIDVAAKLSNLPQCHFIGMDDKTIPPFIIRNFKQRAGDNSCIQVIEYKGVTHNKGWKERWSEILNIPVHCKE